MKPRLLFTTAVLLGAFSFGVIAEPQDHQEHHPEGASKAEPAPASPPAEKGMPKGKMMQGMPQECQAAMKNMPQSCMKMMMQMMPGGMGGSPKSTATHAESASPATKAYMEAAERMHVPMMEGLQASDPDVAFVRGMIVHHQGAIDMARVVLQYGKDPQSKKWADDVIREQQREIAEMEAWLKKNAR